MQHFNWDHSCELKLESHRLPSRPDYESWILVMLDEQDREVYRVDITDPAVLLKNRRTIDIHARTLVGVPVRYFLWPRIADQTFIEKYHFPLPVSFVEQNRAAFDWIRDTSIPDRTVTCVILGGLGNQLFQIMTTLAFARRNGYTPIFDINKKKSPSMLQPQDTYWDDLLKHVVEESRRYRCDFRKQETWGDPSFTYHPVPRMGDHMQLYGYFMSFRYFDHYYDLVREAVLSNPEIRERVEIGYRAIVKQHGLGARPVVSVHVRRGDSLQNPSLEKPGAGYYRRAQAGFQDADFLVFSDDHDWCRENLDDGPNRHFVEGESDYMDLLLMSKCDHHIIANSTFSWWAAYLNPSPDKRVIYPYPWFRGEKHERNFNDFIPSGWMAIQP